MKQDQELRLLEAVCVQHEIDHLMGKTIHDLRGKINQPKEPKRKLVVIKLMNVTIKKGHMSNIKI